MEVSRLFGWREGSQVHMAEPPGGRWGPRQGGDGSVGVETRVQLERKPGLRSPNSTLKHFGHKREEQDLAVGGEGGCRKGTVESVEKLEKI